VLWDNSKFVKVLGIFVQGLLIQGTELLQTMKDLKRTKLAESVRQNQRAYSNRPLQTGGVLTVTEGRAMVEKFKEDERSKAEALIK